MVPIICEQPGKIWAMGFFYSLSYGLNNLITLLILFGTLMSIFLGTLTFIFFGTLTYTYV